MEGILPERDETTALHEPRTLTVESSSKSKEAMIEKQIRAELEAVWWFGQRRDAINRVPRHLQKAPYDNSTGCLQSPTHANHC